MTFGLHEDISERGRRHDEIRFRWSDGPPLLPEFRGKICFRIERERTQILIDGIYAPSLGPLGCWFDRALGKRMARAGLQDLGERMAAYLAARERSRRLAHGLGEGGAHEPGS